MLAMMAAAAVWASAASGQAQVTPRAAVWLQPAGTALITRSLDQMYWSVGTTVAWGERGSLVFEAAYLREHVAPSTFGSDDVFWGWDYLILSGGRAFSFGQRAGPLEGVFIQPKAVLVLLRNRYGYTGPEHAASDETVFGGGLEAGVDVGLHLRFGPVYVAPVAGIAAGYGRGPLRSLTMYPLNLGAQLGSGFRLDVNLNLLRVGGVF